jgi:hypothetical protein
MIPQKTVKPAPLDRLFAHLDIRILHQGGQRSLMVAVATDAAAGDEPPNPASD